MYIARCVSDSYRGDKVRSGFDGRAWGGGRQEGRLQEEKMNNYIAS